MPVTSTPLQDATFVGFPLHSHIHYSVCWLGVNITIIKVKQLISMDAYYGVTHCIQFWLPLFNNCASKPRNPQLICAIGPAHSRSQRAPTRLSKISFRTILGAFAKLQRATISLYMSVRREKLDSHWMDFHEISYLRNFRKYVAEVQASLKSDKNNRYFIWRPTYIYVNISLSSP